MRDLLLQVAIYGLLPLVFVRPMFGLLLYSWLSYLRPQELAWGEAREQPFALAVAVVMILGYLAARRREAWPAWRAPIVLLSALCAWITLSAATAVIPALATTVWGLYWKAILIAVLTTALVRDWNRFRWLVGTMAFGIGLWGVQFAVYGLLRGGARFNDGPGGMISDNNAFAVALCMVVPLLLAIAIAGRNPWLRLAAAGTALLDVVTVLFTFSRGGLLSLIAVSAVLVARGRHRLRAACLLLLAVLAFAVFSSESLQTTYLARANTILDETTDESVRGRLDAWRTSWRVFRAYPLLGVGPDNLQAVFWRYSPNTDRFRVSHNAALQLLCESGLPALLLFIALFAVTAVRLERLRRQHSGTPVEIYARMLQASFAAYVTGAMFLNLAYFEMVYHLLGVSVSLELVAEAQARAAAAPEAGALPEAPADAKWWRARPAAAR